MERFTFTEKKTVDRVGGKVYVYFDEQESVETVLHKDEVTVKETQDSYPVFSYQRAEVEAEEAVTKAAIVNAIVRSRYSQDEAEAIFRHKLAGDESSEFSDFNNFAEAAKTRALEILGETV